MANDAQESEGGIDSNAVKQLADAREKITNQLGRVIIGQQDVIEELLISMFSQGHCLLEGVPGLAKTLLISTLADTLNLSFSRIQFTPDLMPADITGTEVLEENKKVTSFSVKINQLIKYQFIYDFEAIYLFFLISGFC